jgi:hypothetical protein
VSLFFIDKIDGSQWHEKAGGSPFGKHPAFFGHPQGAEFPFLSSHIIY